MTIQAIGDKVLLRRDPVTVSAGGVLLKDTNQNRPPYGSVVSAGSLAFMCKGGKAGDDSPRLQAGQRVLYNQMAVIEELTGDAAPFGLDGDVSDYAFIRACDCLSVVAA